jgi:hypothetical protein
MTPTSTVMPNTGRASEAVALARVLDALTWRHVLAAPAPDDPDYELPGQMVVIYPDFLSKLGLVFATGDLGMDPLEELWPIYQGILEQIDTRQDECPSLG